MRSFTVYILTNSTHSTLYTGFTNNLGRRLAEHRSGSRGFTGRYRLCKLVYFEEHSTALDAIAREKQIKAGSRRKKIELIESTNPEWKDLAPHVG